MYYLEKIAGFSVTKYKEKSQIIKLIITENGISLSGRNRLYISKLLVMGANLYIKLWSQNLPTYFILKTNRIPLFF